MKMNRRVGEAVVVLGVALGLAGCGVAKKTKAAEAEVDRFHQHWNAGEFQAVFDEAHLQFRSAQPADEMKATLEKVKKHYGDLKSSKRRSWGMNSDQGVTDIKLSYDSAFEHGEAVEAFLFRMTGEKALLASYDIMTPETVAKKDAEKKEAANAKRKTAEADRKAASDARKTDQAKP
jgi:hypothetical protein